MKELDYEELNFLVKETSGEYDANEKYLAFKKKPSDINIYKIAENQNIKENIPNKYQDIFCSIKVQKKINDFKLNPNFQNILLVAIHEKILFFSIPEDFKKTQKIEPKYVFNENNIIISQVEFNPINSHIIALTNNINLVKIWTLKGTSTQKIKCEEDISEIKWNHCGRLLGIVNDTHIIKIYNCLLKKFIYILNFDEQISNFGFCMEDKILVQDSTENEIFVYKFDANHKSKLYSEKKINYKYILRVNYESFLVNEYSFILNSKNNKIQIYNDFTKPFYSHDNSLFNSKVIKTPNDILIFKIINVDGRHVQLIIIKDKFNLFNKNDKQNIIYKKLDEDKNEEEKKFHSSFDTFDFSRDNLKEDYFKDCTLKYLNIFESLHHKFNEDINECENRKKYFKISELITNMEDNKNKNLITLRNEVEKDINNLLEKEELKKKEKGKGKGKGELKLFKSIKEEYMFLLNLLIKDETNKELLKRYLLFLKKNEIDLEKEKIPHEKFKDELEYYSIFFEKKELVELFQSEYKSQKEILVNLLNDYMYNIKQKTLEKFKEQTKKNIKQRYFNQPLSFKFKELIYYDSIIDISYDIENLEINKEEILKSKLYILQEISKLKLIEKYEHPKVLIPLIYYVCHPGPEENFKHFLNIITPSISTDKAEKEKIELHNNYIDNNGQNLLIDEKSSPEPKEISFEEYNYNYLSKNSYLNLDITRIKMLLSKTLKSRVFQEVLEYLTGNNNYQAIYNDEMISEFIEKIIFIPTNFSGAVSFHDYLSLVTVISTTHKEISSTFIQYHKEQSDTLENGVIIAIIYHEYGHSINAIISFKENDLQLHETPRKKYLNFKEGGYYLEIALFGRVIEKLTYKEALYILNENNYNKSLEEFRKGFMELSYQDLVIKGQFDYLNSKDESKLKTSKDSVTIKAKEDNDEFDEFENLNISIPLRNDILGRNITEEDLKPYFN